MSNILHIERIQRRIQSVSTRLPNDKWLIDILKSHLKLYGCMDVQIYVIKVTTEVI